MTCLFSWIGEELQGLDTWFYVCMHCMYCKQYTQHSGIYPFIDRLG